MFGDAIYVLHSRERDVHTNRARACKNTNAGSFGNIKCKVHASSDVCQACYNDRSCLVLSMDI